VSGERGSVAFCRRTSNRHAVPNRIMGDRRHRLPERFGAVDDPPTAPVPATTARAVVRETFGICRRRAPILAAIGISLFGPIALIDALVARSVHDGLAAGGGTRVIAIGTYIVISLVLLGSALCAGLLETLVGREFGHVDLGLRAALRRLPYGRLVGVDISQALLVGVGTLLGIVPGVLAFTGTCLAGSLVMVEQRGVRSALRRSIQLVRRRFWLTLVVITLPVAVEHQVLHALEAWLSLPFVALWAMHAVAAVIVIVPVVVAEITLVHHLRRDEQRLIPAGAPGVDPST
jgi:hypothetical protein